MRALGQARERSGMTMTASRAPPASSRSSGAPIGAAREAARAVGTSASGVKWAGGTKSQGTGTGSVRAPEYTHASSTVMPATAEL